MTCASALTLRRHFVDLLESKNLMTPAVTMWKTNWRWSSTTVLGQQARNFPSCKELSFLPWSDVAFDRWPTHLNRVLSKSQAIELLAFLRVTARSRKDQDREHLLVLPHSSLPQWPLPPLWASWIFEEFAVRLSFSPFLLDLSDAPESTTNSRSSAYLGFGRRVKSSFVRFLELADIFCQVPCSSAGASLLFQGCVLCSFLEFWSTRIALSKFALLHDDAPFLSRMF